MLTAAARRGSCCCPRCLWRRRLPWTAHGAQLELWGQETGLGAAPNPAPPAPAVPCTRQRGMGTSSRGTQHQDLAGHIVPRPGERGRDALGAGFLPAGSASSTASSHSGCLHRAVLFSKTAGLGFLRKGNTLLCRENKKPESTKYSVTYGNAQ